MEVEEEEQEEEDGDASVESINMPSNPSNNDLFKNQEKIVYNQNSLRDHFLSNSLLFPTQ